MIPRSAALAVVLSAAATGCAAGTEAPEAVGYVLLDRDARAAGHLVQGSFEGAPVLPVGLDAAEPVAFASSVGRTVFEARPGMLAHVHGAAGAVEWLRLGEDASDERLRVYGSKESATDLAGRLAAHVEGGGDGLWTLAAPGILERASFLEAPEGIVEAAPESMLAGAPALELERSAVLGAVDGRALPRSEPEATRQALVVGVYTAGQRALFLDASGGFSLEDACSGEVVGRGRFRTEGERVVLDSDTAPMVLTWESGELRDPSGGKFAPLVDTPASVAGGAP